MTTMKAPQIVLPVLPWHYYVIKIAEPSDEFPDGQFVEVWKMFGERFELAEELPPHKPEFELKNASFDALREMAMLEKAIRRIKLSHFYISGRLASMTEVCKIIQEDAGTIFHSKKDAGKPCVLFFYK